MTIYPLARRRIPIVRGLRHLIEAVSSFQSLIRGPIEPRARSISTKDGEGRDEDGKDKNKETVDKEVKGDAESKRPSI